MKECPNSRESGSHNRGIDGQLDFQNPRGFKPRKQIVMTKLI